MMVLENLNFPEAEKKFSTHAFKFMDIDFPALTQARVVPTANGEPSSVTGRFTENIVTELV